MFRRSLIIFLMYFYCFDTTFANVLKETKVTLEPKPEDCRPQPTYIPWPRVRDYLNKYYNMDLPTSVTGPPLKVMKCHQDLAPCRDENTFCGIKSNQSIKRRIPLTVNGRNLNSELILDFYEDETCRCVTENVYERFTHHDVSRVPYIWQAVREEL